MKSNILAFLVLVSTFAVVSSKAAEPVFTINSDAGNQAEDSPRQIIDAEAFAEEMGYWYDGDMVDSRPAAPPKPNPKPTKTAALEEVQLAATPDAHDHEQHDHATDDEFSDESKDAIEGEEPEIDEDLVGKFWSDEFEDWDMYGWDNTHDEF